MTPKPPPRRVFSTGSDQARAMMAIGLTKSPLQDLYYFLVKSRWGYTFGLAATLFLGINLIYGLLYRTTGSIANADVSSFADHFFFSVHTFATIGYGSMYPTSVLAEWIVTTEAFVSAIYTALITGLVFAKFSRPKARMLWSDVCTVSTRDGVPALLFRMANTRVNHIIDAHISVSVMLWDTTLEGERVRRIVDVPVTRSTSPTFLLSWTVICPMVGNSPLAELTPEDWIARDAELLVIISGYDEDLGQHIYDRHSYLAAEVMFGKRFADIIRIMPDGGRGIDYTQMNEVVDAPLDVSALGPARNTTSQQSA